MNIPLVAQKTLHRVVVGLALLIFLPAFFSANPVQTIMLVGSIPFVLLLFWLGEYILRHYIIEQAWSFLLRLPQIIADDVYCFFRYFVIEVCGQSRIVQSLGRFGEWILYGREK